MAELIEIEVREDGSRVVQRNLEEVARSTEQVAASVALMKSALMSIQGTIKAPNESLRQLRAALQALQSVMKTPGAFFDPKVIDFASSSLNRLKDTTATFAKTAPANVSAAIGRIEIAIAGLEAQIQRAIRAQQMLATAQQQTARASASAAFNPQQSSFGFMNQPMQISGPGWQLEGQFKKVADNAKEAAGTIASLAAPTQQFATAAKTASTSAQQLNLNLGAANQTSFAFMNTMAAQTKPVNAAAKQYMTIGQVWTQNTKQAQQLSFGFMNVAGGAKATGGAAAAAAPQIGSLTNAFWNLRNVIYIVSTVLFLRELKEYIDSWIAIENSVRLSTQSQNEAAVVMDKLFQAAQKARTPVEELVRLYRRMSQAQTMLGASQQQMIDTVEGVGMAIAIQGTSIHDARGALLQLGQSFGMARVRAQEFNSINENAPRILMAIAEHIPGAAGSVERLRQIMIKGGISGRQMFEAFQKALPKIRKEFEDVRPTIGQAFAKLDNALGKFIYDQDKAVGMSEKFARAVMWLADHLNAVAIALVAIGGVAIVAAWSTIISLINKATIAMHAFNVAVMRNPWGLLVTGIAVAATALYLYRDDLILTEETQTSVGDYMRAVWSGIGRSIHWAWARLVEFKSAMIQVNEEAFKQDSSKFLSWLASAFTGLKVLVNSQIGTMVFLGHALEIVFQNATVIIRGLVLDMLNKMLEDVEKWINAVIIGLNLIKAATGRTDFIPLIELRFDNKKIEDEAAKVKQLLIETFAKDLTADYVGKVFDQLQAQANRFAMERALKRGDADLNKPPPPPPGGATQDDKLQKELDRLRSTIDPVWGALKNLIDAEETLNKAVKAGLITRHEANRLLDMTAEHYHDAIHPFEALEKQLLAENEAMEETTDARKAMIKTLEQVENLKKKEPNLTQEQIRRLYELNYANIHGIKIKDEEKRLIDEIHGKQKKLATSLEALNNLYAKGKIDAAEYGLALAKLKADANMADFGDAFAAKFVELGGIVKNFAQTSGEILATFVNSFADGLSNVIARSLVEWESFKKLFYDMARVVLTQLISAFIRLGLQMALTHAIGQSLSKVAFATNMAMAKGLALAYAPAAAFASLASFGENSLAANAGIASTLAFAEGMAAGSLVSLERGGYTGDLPRNSVAGVVHGQEFVVNAPATSANRAVLEAMNQGAVIQPGGGEAQVNITIENYSGANIQAQRIGPNEIRIIAREEAVRAVHEDGPGMVAGQMNDPNSKIHRSMTRNTTARPRR